MSNFVIPPTGAALADAIRESVAPVFESAKVNQTWSTIAEWAEAAYPTSVSFAKVDQVMSSGPVTKALDIILRLGQRVSLIAFAAVTLGLLYLIGTVIYNIFFHPLARYPGPFLAKFTSLYGGYHAWKGDLHIDMHLCHQKYGNYVRYAPNRLLVNTNTGLKTIYGFSKNFQKSQSYNVMVHQAPNTLTHIDKAGHGRKRRIISQGFSDASLRGYETKIMEHVNQMISSLASSTTAENMASWANYLTFDIMSSVVFGECFGLLTNPKYRFVPGVIEASNVRTSVLLQAGIVAFRRLDRHLFPLAIIGRNQFLRFVGKLLGRRMTTGELKRRDVFSFLLDAKDPETGDSLSRAEICAESTTMIVAGSDTSSTAIAACFFYLSRNPEAYARVAAEVRSVFGKQSDVRLGAELNSCTYLKACIDEALRMSPPAGSSLWREIVGDNVKIDGKSLPKGVEVGTCIYAIHHNATYYPEPYVFKPERWLNASSTEEKTPELVLAQSAFTPFSIGPRACIGKGLALVELMLTMASVLSSMDFSTASGEDALVGAGRKGLGAGREEESEFQLRDHVTGAKEGPILHFEKRE